MHEGRRLATDGRPNATKYVFAGTHAREEDVTTATKVCPRCGEVLFSDMDVCFGCLYDFARDRQRSGRAGSQRLANRARPDATPLASSGDVRGPAREHDLLDDIELDEIDDETEELFGEASDEGATTLPRHRKAPDDEPDSTIDLGRAGTGQGPSAPRVFRVVARSKDMQVGMTIPPWGLTVGRGVANDIVLTARSVSRLHLRFVPQEDGVLAEDCGATNPATIRGERIDGAASLRPGDAVMVCGTEFEIEELPANPAV